MAASKTVTVPTEGCTAEATEAMQVMVGIITAVLTANNMHNKLLTVNNMLNKLLTRLINNNRFKQ